ncbi:TetR/AcrR family transcriptional regulator [Streptacidiphilus carbonis]|uniref:TetR/AcrR family transcriptional regulator n=1 Tax=Streptacidiphilus carbonis TaxID=105422 RepID=UPI0005AB777A|nr:TetR/AcrR family transcriptional regulator [Streptacidiphilus carbonis]
MVGRTAVKPGTPRLRADATRNRERIVAAAQEAFVEFGADVPLDEIARRAGIGNATLYRHFPDRRELARSVVLSVIGTIATEAEAIAAAAPDAFTALEEIVHGAVEWKVGALCPMFSEWMDVEDPELLVARNRLDNVVEGVFAAGYADGTLRDDVGPGDVMILASQIARPLPGVDPIHHLPFVHRHIQLVLDGLRAPKRSVLPGHAATLQDLRDRGVVVTDPQH